MMDGDTIGSEENTVESETFVAHAIKNEWVVEASSETTIKAGVELG